VLVLVLLPLVLMGLNIDIVAGELLKTQVVWVWVISAERGGGDLRKRSLICMNAWHTHVKKNRKGQENSAWKPLAGNAFLIKLIRI